jgi:hypothetical protein
MSEFYLCVHLRRLQKRFPCLTSKSEKEKNKKKRRRKVGMIYDKVEK